MRKLQNKIYKKRTTCAFLFSIEFFIFRLKIYDFGGEFSVGEDYVGVRGRTRERGEQRAGADKRYAVALCDVGKVGVSVKDEIATEFLRAEFE